MWGDGGRRLRDWPPGRKRELARASSGKQWRALAGLGQGQGASSDKVNGSPSSGASSLPGLGSVGGAGASAGGNASSGGSSRGGGGSSRGGRSRSSGGGSGLMVGADAGASSSSSSNASSSSSSKGEGEEPLVKSRIPDGPSPAIDVPFEIVVACGADGVTIQPGGYRIATGRSRTIGTTIC